MKKHLLCVLLGFGPQGGEALMFWVEIRPEEGEGLFCAFCDSLGRREEKHLCSG
jgi:hypothetical protein